MTSWSPNQIYLQEIKKKTHQKTNEAKHAFILGTMESKEHTGLNPTKMFKDEAEMCKICSSTM